MADMMVARPASTDGIVLPPLPESQLARPPTAPGRQIPGDGSQLQVQDDYFTLPKIGGGSRLAEDIREDTQGGSRIAGSKSSKHGADDEGMDVDTGAGRGSTTRGEGVGSKSSGGQMGAVGFEGRDGAESSHDDRGSHLASGQAGQGGFGFIQPDSRAGTTGMGAAPTTRRGPLPSQRKAESGKVTGSMASSLVPRTGTTSSVGKVGVSTGGTADETGMVAADERHMLSPRGVEDEGGEGDVKESTEQRLERIRASNVRRDYRPGVGAGGGGGGREVNELNEARLQHASSPRRPRPAEMEYSGKTQFEGERPEVVTQKAERRGQMFAAPYGKERGHEENVIDLEVIEIKKMLRAGYLRLVDKSAPDIEFKPPPSTSVEAGSSAKNKHLQNLPELPDGSDEFPRGQNGEGRKQWYAREGDRAGVVRLPLGGNSSSNDVTEFRLQAAVAHGIDIGFERTMAHSTKRMHGTQMSEKDPSLGNTHVPSGGYLPSEANRTKHTGSDGSRAQARAEVAVAAPIKLPRQEGFMVDRNKDSGIEESRVAAVRVTATREQAITTNIDITEEQMLAQKHSGVLEGPGKLEDTDYDVLDLRPSELAIKVKEKRGAYAVPKDSGADERRDSRPVPMELQLKPPAFERVKGTGEDKMRSSYY